MEETKNYKHPSYGLLEVSRCVSNGKQNLFGSPLAHNNTIRLRLYRGEVERSLNHDWYHQAGLAYEVEMSPNQWAELVSSFGQSPGVPCTIKFEAGKGHIDACPYTPARELFDAEFNESIKKTTSSITQAIDSCMELIDKKSITKADRVDILNRLQTIQRQLNDTIPYIQRSFGEEMDKTVIQAKNELQAWAQNIQMMQNKNNVIDMPPPELCIED